MSFGNRRLLITVVNFAKTSDMLCCDIVKYELSMTKVGPCEICSFGIKANIVLCGECVNRIDVQV